MIETLSSPSSPGTDGYVEWCQFPQPPPWLPRGEAAERSEADEGWRELESSKIPVEWCETEINTIHPAAFMNQPVAAPHQAFLPIGSEVPLVKKSSFPRGKPRTQKFLAISIQPTALLRELREATSLPYMAYAILQPLPNSEVHQVGAASPQRVAKLAIPTTAFPNHRFTLSSLCL